MIALTDATSRRSIACCICRSEEISTLRVCEQCTLQFCDLCCLLVINHNPSASLPCGCKSEMAKGCKVIETATRVLCPWAVYGCARELSVYAMELHAAQCCYRPLNYENKNCSKSLLLGKSSKHEQELCDYKVISYCQKGCSLPLARCERENHSCVQSLIMKLSQRDLQCKKLRRSLNIVIQMYQKMEKKLQSFTENKSGESIIKLKMNKDKGQLGFKFLTPCVKPPAPKTNPSAKLVGLKRRSTVSLVIPGSAAEKASLVIGDILLQVNGHDLSDASHEETVQAFHTAQEPIVVEVLRRSSNSTNPASPQSKTPCIAANTMNSVSTQTDAATEAELFARCFHAPSPPPLTYNLDNLSNQQITTSDFEGDDAEQSYDIEYDEVILHRETSKDRIGLTLCYGPTEEDGITDIFIGEVESDSIAGQNGCIHEGDQILQINRQDVHTREEAIKYFSENRSDISLLVCRPSSVQLDDGFVEESSPQSTQRHRVEGMTLIEEGSEEEEEESTVTDTATLPSQKEKEGKDSGVGHDSAANDESSEQEYDSPHYDSHNSSHTSADQEPEYKDLAQEQAAMFREVLEARCSDMNALTKQMDVLCALVEQHQQCQHEVYGSPRLVPKMGTRTIHPNSDSPSSSTLNSNSSKTVEVHNPDTAYNTAESSNSSPVTLELTRDQSSSTLCLVNENCVTPQPKEHSRDRKSHDSSSSSSRKSEKRQKHRNSRSTSKPSASAAHSTCAEIAYTNEENLAQTIAMQQQLLLEQSRHNTLTRGSKSSETDNQLPNMSDAGSQMEYVLKIRSDGTRYVTRRPVRNKILSDRKKKLENERCGMTTDDDAMSEMKTGRYWSKEDKKRHLKKAQDYRKRKELMKQKLVTLKEVDEGQVNLVELSHKKLYKNTMKDMNFTTVQELLVHGGKIHDPRYNLLSVTTV